VGLTIGVPVVVVPVFVAEPAPAAVRGSLLVGYQIATVFGIIVGYRACYLLAEESGGEFVQMLRRPYFRAAAFVLSGIGTMIAADALLIVVFAARLAAIFGFVGVLLFTMGFTFGFGGLVWAYAVRVSRLGHGRWDRAGC
jgi:Sugar (and other) transporter